VKEAVAGKLKAEEDASLFQAFTLVGGETEQVSVDFAIDAQREATLKKERMFPFMCL
jgi:hypothetical protein